MSNTSKEQLFGTTSNNITKCYKGMALCPMALRRLYDNKIAEDGKIHCVYKIVDRTNNFEYYGKINTHSFTKFKKYVGSGSLLRFFIKEKGIHNFEQHLVEFFETSCETEIKEREIVDADYLKNADTYNMAIGGNNHFKEPKKSFHDRETGRTFVCSSHALDRILKTWNRMDIGQSDEFTNNSHWMKGGTMKKIASKNKVIKLNRLHNEQYEEITAPTQQLLQYLNLGWEVKSPKLWIHKPDQQVYRRGENWRQISSKTKNIMKFVLQGYVPGRPPRYEGAVVDKNFYHRKQKALNKAQQA